MKLTKIVIKHFRLLKDVELVLDARTTVIVGRNNSGKTSLTELFHRILADTSPTFRLEDFSLSAHEDFWKAFQLKQQGAEDDAVRAALPFIEIRMTMEYGSDVADLGPLSDFIIDLNPDSTEAVALIQYQLDEGRIKALFDGLSIDSSMDEPHQKAEVFRTLKERVPRLYKGVLKAVDPDDESNQRDIDWPRLHDLLQSGFINAQRGLDDITHRDRDVLAKILEALFKTARSESADSKDHETADLLDAAVKKIEADIGSQFDEHLKTLVPALSLFGYPGLTDPGLSTETTLDVDSLLTNHTRVRYAGANGITLPETYNGLGTRNLIFILLQLLAFFKDFQARPTSPGVHIIFLEEPEAHLHPQMQEVFIRKLDEIAKVFARLYNNELPWPVQFVVSTHSPHIANEAPFDSTRYFIASPEQSGGIICSTRIKDLSKGLGGIPAQDREFLHKYMTLTRCDLLFADKAVLIEGTSERLLFRKMVEKVDAAQPTGPQLASQYVSVIEVGGAYAHRFFGLLEFLELRTLVITDLDSIDSANGRRACKVSEGDRSSNACIRAWFDAPDITPGDLLLKTDSDKTGSVGYLAYQIPEADDGPCGRSFEDAFMLANTELFEIAAGTAADQEDAAWRKAKDVKKSEFALTYAIEKPEWSVPRYIREGLVWLADGPALTGVEGDTAEAPAVDTEGHSGEQP